MNSLFKNFIFSSCLLVIFFASALGQGGLFVKNYSSVEYKLQAQNFDAAQTSNGVMYFANNGGLLEYNGSEWRFIELKSQHVFSIEVSPRDIIAVGSTSDFGILKYDEIGQSYFASLKKDFNVPNDFSFELREILSNENYIYYFTDNGKVYVWSEEEHFKLQFDKKVSDVVKLDDKRILVLFKDHSLCIIEGKKMQIVAQPLLMEMKATHLTVDKNSIYVLTEEGKILISKSKSKVNFTLVENFSFPVQSYTGIIKSEDKLIVGTSGEGVFLMDLEHKSLSAIKTENGLTDNNIENLFIDKWKNLWVCSSNGISKVEIHTPITLFNHSNGISGTIEGISRMKDHLYLATHSGLFKMNLENYEVEKIEEIENDTYSVSSFTTLKDTFILISELNGLFEMNSNGETKFVASCAPWFVFHYKKAKSLNESDIFLVADDGGLIALERTSNGEYNKTIFQEINFPVFRICADKENNIWLGTESNGIVKIRMDDGIQGELKIAKIEKFDAKSGLPEGQVLAGLINNEIKISGSHGFYSMELKNNRFIKELKLNPDFVGGDYMIHRFFQDEKGRIWVIAFENGNLTNYFIGFGFKNQKTDKWMWETKPFKRISDKLIHDIEITSDGVVWMGGPEGLIRYDENQNKAIKSDFKLRLGKVILGNDSVFFHSSQKDHPEFNFDFSSKNYQFTFFSNNLSGNENNIQYSYFLEGFDSDWSEYKADPIINLMNLHEGKYILKVRAKDEFGNISEVIEIPFVISPPWYRTWLAYILYVLILIGAIFIFVKLYTQRLQQANIKLENIVVERTAEIQEKNVSLEKQKEHITHQKEEIEHINKEIIDSINYAKRLQRAVIPTEEQFKNIAGDSFVLYLPKDIVSGDFYWISEDENYFWYATADCTGHGVPGGFMSMLGVSLLNEIVNENKIKDPNEILDALREKIIHSLNKSSKEGENKDGMDIVMIRLDKQFKTMTFAAANNSFYVFRNGELLDMKADKMPVGFFGEYMKPFNQTEFLLEKGDIIYSFTDGYADQFGGPKGKKFKYKQLEEKLIKASQLPMNEQCLSLEKVFNDWKEGYEQVDDICLIGLKIV